ncbi:class D beta-lactamase [Kordia sp. YSTF-M3]|uniref:beta-lactamase n=1 Tax=Kordia aestuariivivens TaxID=2759037 RepID=A0ABR7QEW3_9FLAO|nr:class D beta-lactamase [Kordia aestuariivivens]
MKKLCIFFLCVFCFSCKEESKKNLKPQEKSVITKNIDNHTIVAAFQKIIDSVKLKGAILVYDLREDVHYSNDFSWAETGKLPASTYKIPNSIIALETGVVADQNTIFVWNGEKRFLKSWEEDLTFTQAFQRSCVPCYQEIAREVGVESMNAYLEKFQYGNIQVDSTNLDSFWLQGNSRITQFQQIDFLTRLYQSKLPISKRTETIMKDIMIVKETETYTLRGKTGWSISDGINNGWFVGYVEKEDKIFFFATNVEPTGKFNQKAFIKNRKEITYKALRQLDILL